MSDIDRLFQYLVRTIQARFPQYLTHPFEVGELYQNILPYRHHRRELGFDTNQDYEVALTELLTGAGGYLTVDDRMRDALQRELGSRNPDPGAFREFATSQVSLNPDAVARVAGASQSPRASMAGSGATAASTSSPPASPPPPPPPPPPAVPPQPATAQRPGAPRPAASPAVPPTPVFPATRASTPATAGAGARTQGGITPGTGETCRHCGGSLPAGRRIVFCPHCGENLTIEHCAACGAELELGWKFCPVCGRPGAGAAT